MGEGVSKVGAVKNPIQIDVQMIFPLPSETYEPKQHDQILGAPEAFVETVLVFQVRHLFIRISLNFYVVLLTASQRRWPFCSVRYAKWIIAATFFSLSHLADILVALRITYWEAKQC